MASKNYKDGVIEKISSVEDGSFYRPSFYLVTYPFGLTNKNGDTTICSKTLRGARKAIDEILL